jgi:hypothetical protein
MHGCLPIGTSPITCTGTHRGSVGVMRMHDCLPIGTIPNHVHRYTLVYGWSTCDSNMTADPSSPERSTHNSKPFTLNPRP